MRGIDRRTHEKPVFLEAIRKRYHLVAGVEVYQISTMPWTAFAIQPAVCAADNICASQAGNRSDVQQAASGYGVASASVSKRYLSPRRQ
ncbi:MAG: hypothetical protein ABI284_08930 [Nitrosospira sp.]